jgi:diguanylate cyclase (GGDEF)-like protein
LKSVPERGKNSVEQKDLAVLGDILFKYLCDMMYAPSKAKLDVEQLPKELQRFGQGLTFFAECATETANFAKVLSRGEIRDVTLPSRQNEMAAPLKSLHSTLSHLTWQTQQVAKGDYKQHVDFMGDFAVAFNTMVQQLDESRKALIEELESGRRKAQALESSNSLFEAITNNMTQLIIVVDRETREWLFLNHQVENILAEKRFRPQLFNWLNSQIDGMAQDAQPHSAEAELLEGDVVQCFSVGCYPLHWHGRNAAAFVLADITDEKKRLKLLEDYAYRDTLTKTYNRHWGMEIMNTWITEKRRFLICFIDIDYLKYVNDQFGHSAGDTYILYVVDVLKNFSKDAFISRLGGDEFMMLDEKYDIESAEARLEEIRTELREQKATEDAINPYSISYGVVEVDKDNTLPGGDLLAIADEKMYKYKRAHKITRTGTATA